MNTDNLYEHRFPAHVHAQRARLWQVLCRRVLQRFIRPEDVVIDLGAGMCEFINHVQCKRKIAIDAHPRARSFAAPGVHVIVGEVLQVLDRIGDAVTDVVFCSNFLEHLPDKKHVSRVLAEVYRILVPGGRLLVIQPNIRVAYREYWDFFDHYVPLSDRSLREAVEAAGFEVILLKPRFLPFTTVTRWPKPAWLFRLYLSLPPLQWLLGKQLLLVAAKPARAEAATAETAA